MARNFKQCLSPRTLNEKHMKRIFYKFVLTMILIAGLMIGMVKGQEARQKWVSKKKNRCENRHLKVNQRVENLPVALDEFEIATYHR